MSRAYGDPPKQFPRSIGDYKERIAACKGGAPAGSNFDQAGPLTEAVPLGNVARRLQLREELTTKKLLWYSPNLRLRFSDAATEFLRPEDRAGWKR